jgi:hypothetical protein
MDIEFEILISSTVAITVTEGRTYEEARLRIKHGPEMA